MVAKGNTKIKVDSTQIEPITAPVAITLTKALNTGKEQRVVIAADSDVFTNIEAKRNEIGEIRIFNTYFSNQVFRWLTNNEYPLNVIYNNPTDTKFNSSQQTRTFISFFLSYILPALILCIGAFVLIRRRRN